jgi:cardiolipin synthase
MTNEAQSGQPLTHVVPTLPVDAVQAALQKTEQRDSTPSNGCGCGLPQDDTRHLESREDDRIRLFTEGDTLYAAMLASIRGARHAIRMESYIFASDEIGWQFAEALAERAAAGIDVRLHLDAAGAWRSSSLALQRHLRDRGVRVRWFHRWRWRQPLRYNRRNHRKLLVVDEHTAYVGGFNIHRESSRRFYGASRWRDTHAEISGPLVNDAARLFDAIWRGHRHWMPAQHGAQATRLVSNHTRTCRHQIHCLYSEAFASARERIYLTTPYFVPDPLTQQRLMAAARRGIDVRLLVPSISDVPITRWAAHAFYGALMSAGVRIYEYLPRMLHAKTVVIDGRRATLGTANLDYRSFFLNYELLLAMAGPCECALLEQHFIDDLSESRPVVADTWASRRWAEKLLEGVGWVLRRWL